MFVGYYSPGYALGNIISIFVVPFGFLLTATLSEYFDNNKIYNLKIILTYSIKYFLMLAIPSAFGLSILSRKLLTILTTPEIALNGYLITPFAAASTVVFGAYIIISHIPVLIKKTKVTGAIWMIAALINLLLNMIAIPRIGILGAAITTLIAITLAFALTTYYSFRYIKFHIDFLFILKSIFASTIMSLIMLKWNPEGALETIIAVAICAIFYSACLLLLMSFDKGEIKLFLGIIQDLIH
jgi:O-antigen/teichoic acid export membrane protein